MAIHDWTRVDAGIFHDFHTAWIAEIRRVLNGGLLPPPYYALAEQVARPFGPDVLTLEAPDLESDCGSCKMDSTQAPPKVRFTARPEFDPYALKRRTLVIRHVSRHQIIALIEILCPGNKARRPALRSFLDNATSALSEGIHLLLIDLHPPGLHDPNGIHAALWERLADEPFSPPVDKPLTLAAYPAGRVPTAYLEPVAVGDPLLGMPLFLHSEHYVNVPLGDTYRGAYEGVPRYYRSILEAPGAAT